MEESRVFAHVFVRDSESDTKQKHKHELPDARVD